MMKTRPESTEVLYTDDAIVSVNIHDVEEFKQDACLNSRHRIRLCTHLSIMDDIHEMLIVHKKNVCVPPHKHLGKSESIHIIEGLADLIQFNDNGSIAQVLPMGDYVSKRVFYCRMNDSVYHTLLIHSDMLVFHETTNGPFQKGDLQLAPWSPDISDAESCSRYLRHLEESVSGFMMNKEKL